MSGKFLPFYPQKAKFAKSRGLGYEFPTFRHVLRYVLVTHWVTQRYVSAPLAKTSIFSPYTLATKGLWRPLNYESETLYLLNLI